MRSKIVQEIINNTPTEVTQRVKKYGDYLDALEKKSFEAYPKEMFPDSLGSKSDVNLIPRSIWMDGYLQCYKDFNLYYK